MADNEIYISSVLLSQMLEIEPLTVLECIGRFSEKFYYERIVNQWFNSRRNRIENSMQSIDSISRNKLEWYLIKLIPLKTPLIFKFNKYLTVIRTNSYRIWISGFSLSTKWGHGSIGEKINGRFWQLFTFELIMMWIYVASTFVWSHLLWHFINRSRYLGKYSAVWCQSSVVNHKYVRVWIK